MFTRKVLASKSMVQLHFKTTELSEATQGWTAAHLGGMRVELTKEVQSVAGKCMGSPVAGQKAFQKMANVTRRM